MAWAGYRLAGCPSQQRVKYCYFVIIWVYADISFLGTAMQGLGWLSEVTGTVMFSSDPAEELIRSLQPNWMDTQGFERTWRAFH